MRKLLLALISSLALIGSLTTISLAGAQSTSGPPSGYHCDVRGAYIDGHWVCDNAVASESGAGTSYAPLSPRP